MVREYDVQVGEYEEENHHPSDEETDFEAEHQQTQPESQTQHESQTQQPESQTQRSLYSKVSNE